MLDDVTVVVCTYNSLPLVKANLANLHAQLAGAEFIVVDGDSTDGTKEFAAQIVDKVVSDGGKGLAAARQIGATTASRPYVLFAGCDNRIPPETAATMAKALRENKNLAGVGAQTTVIDVHNYWEGTTKRIFHHLINRVGPADIVGTPSMYKREVLIQVPFNEKVVTADDTDLAYRLKKAGYDFAIVDAYVQEKNSLSYKDFRGRWFTYGRSDAEFYRTHYKSWGTRRRIQSLTHPLRKYGLRGAWLFLIHGDAWYIPGLWMATYFRYRSWIRAARSGYYFYSKK